MSREITVINKSHLAGKATAFFRLGEVYMSDVASMVDNVRAALGTGLMDRQNVIDHGSSFGMFFGRDTVTESVLRFHASKLSQLRSSFSIHGFAHLQGCNVGMNHPLLVGLAQIWGVPVVAGTGEQYPILRANLGNYDRCEPSGECTNNVGRP